MSSIEATAVLLGLINVSLIIHRSIWNYPFGLCMVTLYGYIFLEARLYADAILQIYFFVIQVYGWWNWLQGRTAGGQVVVELLDRGGRILALASILVTSFAVGWLMATFTDAAAPFWDATVSGLSVIAQYLLSRRKLESWVLWIVVDLLGVALFWSRGLHMTAGLYLVFLGLAITGLVKWCLVLQRQRATMHLP